MEGMNPPEAHLIVRFFYSGLSQIVKTKKRKWKKRNFTGILPTYNHGSER